MKSSIEEARRLNDIFIAINNLKFKASKISNGNELAETSEEYGFETAKEKAMMVVHELFNKLDV